MRVLDDIAQAAIGGDGIASAAIFLIGPGASDPQPGPELRLAGAAGIAGPPLDGLVAAVRDPRHPIRRSLEDAGPTWNVTPRNPGGPALRSHLPLRPPGAPSGPAVGVLALAHDAPVASGARSRLEQLAGQAAAAASHAQPQEENP
jgi:hypothetical protein